MPFHIFGLGLSKGWAAYSRELEKRPLRTQIVTSGTLYMIGDLVAQRVDYLEHRRKGVAQSSKTDWSRITWSGAFGAVCIAPGSHWWFENIDMLMRRWTRPGTIPFIGGKVFLDCSISVPLYSAAYFLFMGILADGESMETVMTRLRNDFPATYAAELMMWPLAQAINFSVIPVAHQLLFTNLVCLVDSTLLSWVKHRALGEESGWAAQLLHGGGAVQSETQRKKT